jgi:hypothetical protein
LLIFVKSLNISETQNGLNLREVVMNEQRASSASAALCRWEIVQYGIELAAVQGARQAEAYMAEQGIGSEVIFRVLNQPDKRREGNVNAEEFRLRRCVWLLFSYWRGATLIRGRAERGAAREAVETGSS